MKTLLGAILLLLITLAPLTASMNVLERSENQILLEYRLDRYSLSREQNYIRIDASDMAYESRIGAPLLPYSETKVGIPPQGSVSVTVLSSSSRSENLAEQLLPVPEVRQGKKVSEYRYKMDETLYREDPRPLVVALEPASFRGFGFVTLQINPFAYDGARTLRVTDQLLIRVDLSGNTGYRAAPADDELAEMLMSQLLNPEQARFWQNDLRDPVYYADFSRSDYWLRLETNHEGMYKITPSQMSGFPLEDIDPRSFRLFSNGGTLLPYTILNAGNEFKEIPIRVEGESDGSFDSGDFIVFYGTNRDGIGKNQALQTNPTYYNPYSGNTVYWLTFGGEYAAPPLRMATTPELQSWTQETSTFKDQVRLETEAQRREIIGFDWYLARLFGYTTADYQFEMKLSDLAPGADQYLSFQIREEDIGGSHPHSISIYINGSAVPADTTGAIVFRWSGDYYYNFYKKVSGFTNGTNTIRLRVLRDETDNLFLNWIALDHSRLINKISGQLLVNQLALNYGVPVRYGVSGNTEGQVYQIDNFYSAQIVPLQNPGGNAFFVANGTAATRYVLSSDSELLSPVNITAIEPRNLVSNPNQYDNIIIAADEYYNQAQSLAELYWQDLGKHSLAVKQSDILNQFNGGHPDPAALRQYLRYVYYNYPSPRLTSVTLLGLGSIDWRNNSGQAAAKNKVLVYQRNDTASDDYFAMMTQPAYPELLIGRYPVRNTNELNNMLSNFQNYTENAPGGWWRDSMVFLGDDLFNGDQEVSENTHTRQTQEAASIIHPSILTDKIFAWEYEYDEYQNKPRARDDMMAAINEGRLVWCYIGHGGFDSLGAEDYFEGASDLGRFHNPDKLPVFMAASCSVSQFDYWGFDSLGQKVVLLDNLGAIASFAATRLSNPFDNVPMFKLVLNHLANLREPLGYSIMAGKMQYSSNDNDSYYILLGDPLLRVIPPLRDSLMTIIDNGAAKDPILNARQLAILEGGFSPSVSDGTGETRVFNPEIAYYLDPETLVSHRGSQIFRGSSSVTGGEYQSSFIVPDDVVTGETGLIVSYMWDPALKQDYVNFYHPLSLSDEAITANNPDAPEIKLFLGSMDFRPGDTVGTNPTLYARISDSNGINVTGSSGHNILLVLDGSLQPIAATGYFSYDLDSHTQGLLTYPFADLAEGPHTLQVIAFDNFNQPAVASTDFIVRKSGDLAIERFLIYPNPMGKETSFTFMLSLDCDLTVDIFTVSGKRVHSFKVQGRQGFNSIAWNGKDDRGDRFANNTYFVRIRAAANGKKAEKTERLVIYN